MFDIRQEPSTKGKFSLILSHSISDLTDEKFEV